MGVLIGTSPVTLKDEESPIALASAQQFRTMLDGGLVRYLAHLDKDQQGLVNMKTRGLLLVKGGAGTGKTAVALHRLLALSQQQTLADTGPKNVLFLCYNNLLAKVARQLLETLGNGTFPDWVEVATFHAWCQDFLHDTGKPGLRVDEDGCKQTVFQAIGSLSREQRDTLGERKGHFIDEEIVQVIKQNGITDLEQYVNFERRGRRQSLKRPVREAIWTIYQRAHEYQQAKGICRYCDMPLLALEALQVSPAPPTYRAIVIDEGQDCSPVLIRLARRLLGEGNNQLTVFADPAQAIFDCGFQWTQSELRPTGGNIRWLRKTYRTTRPIYELTRPLLEGHADLQEELTNLQPPERFGPKPQLIVAENEAELYQELVERIAHEASRRPANEIGVLAPRWDTLRSIETQLRGRGIPVSAAERGGLNLSEPTVKLLSIYSVKGLDFPVVFVVAPKTRDFGGSSYADLPETRRMLYVALTRSSEHLTIGALFADHHPLIEALDDEYYDAQGTQAQRFVNGRGVTVDATGKVHLR